MSEVATLTILPLQNINKMLQKVNFIKLNNFIYIGKIIGLYQDSKDVI